MIKLQNVDFDGESEPMCPEPVNTLHWHASDHQDETLHSYTGLVT